MSNNEQQTRVACRSVGGVPKRSAFHAWLPAAIQCESKWKLVAHFKPVMQGVAIDTKKFFDNVPQAKALKRSLPWDLKMSKLPCGHTGLSTFTDMSHSMVPLARIHLPQGDPMSMIAAAALLGQRTLEIPLGV